MKKKFTLILALILILSAQTVFAVDATTSVTQKYMNPKTEIYGNYLGYMGENDQKVGVLIKIYQDNMKDKALVNTYPVPNGAKVEESKFICDVFNKADGTLEIYGKDMLVMNSKKSLINFIGKVDKDIFKGNSHYIKDTDEMIPFKLVKETEKTGPSDWAASQVYSTVADGIVPIELQQNFLDSINRRDFLHLIMNSILHTKNCDIEKFIETEDLEIEDEYDDIKDDLLILAATKMRLVRGYGNRIFGPEDLLSREQAAVIISNAVYYLELEYEEIEHEYEDEASISNWAKRDVMRISEIKDPISKTTIMQGKEIDDKLIFDPQGNLTIEQAIIMAARFMGLLK